MIELSPERKAFADSVRTWVDKYCSKQRALELEQREHEYPFELWDQMATAGFHSVGIDEAYGGSGGTPVDTAILAVELSRNLAGLAWVWAISSFAGARAIALAGTEEQKHRYLTPLAAGECRFAIAVTEPSGGTDLLGGMRTRAVRVGDRWQITGQKMWSTGARQADHLLLLAKTGDGEGRRARTTLFLVPTTAAGLDFRYIPKLGMRAIGSCEVFLDQVEVGPECVLGEVDRGFTSIVGALNNERILSAALALGMLNGVLEEAVRYAGEREAFDRPIGGHQAVAHMIADIAIWRKQAELLTFDAAWREEQGLDCSTEAKIAKVATSEYAVQAADHGIQILGGMGLSTETHMQRYWRDVRQFRIAPISNEMARNSIAESFGLPRSY